MREKLAIFDLDGTLFDTRSVNFMAYQKALAEEGIALDREIYETKCNGKYYKDYMPLLVEHPSEELMERVHNRKKELYPQFLSYAVENTHLFQLIESMKQDYIIALVTTASKQNCQDILAHFGKTDCFEYVLTHNDITKVKPDPEGFLKAMEHFQISPENTLIFEDSPSGIEAARRSGAGILTVVDFS